MLHPVAQIAVGDDVVIGGDAPLALIAGPCVLESEDSALRTCAALCHLAAQAGLPLVFKSSFDKANRTSLGSPRGPGLERGLEILAGLRERFGVAVTTDVHLPSQAARVAEAVDLLQIPAFLCRQTDLICACAETGLPVNIKKGQFLSPAEVGPMVAKAALSGADGVLVTERGSCFGYQNLVVDMRTLPRIRELGVPVCFDATHSVQQPGAAGGRSGGERRFAPTLARAAVAVGIDAVFMEVHEDPDSALSDGPNMIPLAEVGDLLFRLKELDSLIRG